MRGSIVSEIIDPAFSIVQSLLAGDIKDTYSSSCISEVNRRDTPVLLLTSRVPYLQLHLRIRLGQVHHLRQERSPNRCILILLELTLRVPLQDGCLAYACVAQQYHLEYFCHLYYYSIILSFPL